MRAEEIKHIRACLRMSQADLARTLAVSRFAVNSWESGRRDISPSTAKFLRILYEFIKNE